MGFKGFRLEKGYFTTYIVGVFIYAISQNQFLVY